jgi:hypothetical protein
MKTKGFFTAPVTFPAPAGIPSWNAGNGEEAK